jgi:tripartite-type tricarboxylate transporter receptor subunit TctC
MQRRSWIAALVLACTAFGASAQGNYPDQPIKWIVPYPPGGGTDTLARTLAEAMRAGLGQPLVIENRPGAATNIAADAVAKSKPDGYTVMSADNALMAFNEHLFKKLPYDPQKDFTYIGTIGRLPLALVVNPKFPAGTFAEFLAYVKAHPGKVDYASPGPGSPHHLAMEMFKTRTRTSLTHIAYKGAAPAVQDVVGGQVPVMFLDLAAGLPFIQSGKVRVLAIGTAKRSPALPDVPTLSELGVAGADVFAFQGLVGPAGLPPAVVARLNQELNKALGDPGVAKKFADFGIEPITSTPEAFRAMARSESGRWGPIIKANRITLD